MERKFKIFRIIICFIFLCFIGVCVYYFSTQSKKVLEKQIIAMEGMQINLNFENARTIYNGVDSSYASSIGKKLIVFVDSTSCSGCFVGRLTDYFEVNDSLSSLLFELIVVLNPRSGLKEDIVYRLHNENYRFWCIVDGDGEFIKLNPDIPDNKLLHTFTLDDANKIILVGDPTRNKKIRELFFKVIRKEKHVSLRCN